MIRLLIIPVFFLSSCGTVKKVFVKTHSVKDTAVVTTSHSDVTTKKDIDTVLHFRGDTAISNKMVDVPKDVEVHETLETPTLIIKTDIKDGKLKTTAIEKPKDIPVKQHTETNAKTDSKTQASGHQENKDSTNTTERTGIACIWYIVGFLVIAAAVAGYLLFTRLAPPK